LTPSPIIITGPFLRSDSTTRIFLVGRELRAHQVDRQAGGDRLCDLVAVAGRQHDALDAERAQIMQQLLGAGAQPVGQDQHAGEPAVDCHRRRQRAGCALAREHRRGSVADDAGNVMQPADQYRAAVDPAGDALARHLHHVGRDRQRQAFVARLGHDGLRDDVLTGLVERRGDPQ
jgi:hypothetical protein